MIRYTDRIPPEEYMELRRKVKLTLSSARGKEPLYGKSGFRDRPNEDAGAAMDQWLIRP